MLSHVRMGVKEIPVLSRNLRTRCMRLHPNDCFATDAAVAEAIEQCGPNADGGRLRFHCLQAACGSCCLGASSAGRVGAFANAIAASYTMWVTRARSGKSMYCTSSVT